MKLIQYEHTCFHLQKFNTRSQKYETLTRADGLELSVNQFKDVMREFLHNGKELKVDILESIIEELKLFYDCMSKQMEFEFYSGSLLIIYGGATATRLQTTQVKAIDFAHTVRLVSSPIHDSGTERISESGYSLGVKSLISILSDIAENHSCETCS